MLAVLVLLKCQRMVHRDIVCQLQGRVMQRRATDSLNNTLWPAMLVRTTAFLFNHAARYCPSPLNLGPSTAGSVLAVALPLPPAKFSLSNSAPEDDDPVQLSFQLPQGASSFQRQLARLLRDKLKLPEFVLVLVFGVRPWVWLATAAWIFFAPIVAHYELGPLYVLGTICGLIFLNLGTRQAGEASAYSIFNQFRALPGQLTADEIDRQFRQGQM